jgi:murein L,D-transpeptidase YcbB/YkuD
MTGLRKGEQPAWRLPHSSALRSRCLFGVALFWLLLGSAASADPSLQARTWTTMAGHADLLTVPTPPPVNRAWIEQVYSPASPGPVWFTSAGPRPATSVALDALRAAGDRGLVPEDYDVSALVREIEALRAGNREPDAVGRVDKEMTATMLRFLSDLRFGRVRPQQVEPHYRAPAKDAAFAVDLRDAVARDRLAATIDAAEPAFPQYGRLKRLLAHYRDLAALPTIALPPLASPRSKIVEGDAYSGVPALRAQLVRLGDLAADSEWPTNDRYTGALVDAVRRFQGRHGLQTDGVLGKDTLAALNVPLTTRLTQITLSLERLRWLPQLPPGPLIAINIPSFQLWAFADASDLQHATLSMAVVVGRAMRTETPVFIGEMRLVEFSPYWNVPRSILRNELLPRIASDATYLEREAMEVVSVSRDGRTYAAVDSTTIAALRSGEARLRQRPGPRNALGGVKFGLANTMDIYLHATPASELFERTRRDFSHGCIRVREPEALAQFVLQGRREWTAAEIEAAMTSGVNRTVPLAAPFPVIVFYTTAIVDVDGRALFLADVYGHDRKLLDALRGGARVAR